MNSQNKRRFNASLHAAGVSFAIFCSCSAIAASSGAGTGAGGSQRIGGQSPTVTVTVSPKKQAAASAYWTRQRVANAPALAFAIDTGSGAIDTAALDEIAALGPEEAAPAGAAAPGATDLARAAFAADWDALAESDTLDSDLSTDSPADLMAGTAGVYMSWDVGTVTALATIYPHRWMGRLTFNVPGGGASCSATAISGNNIVTAAHCVYDTTANIWYSNWVFTPAYRNGTAPYGTFSASACTILTSWVNLTGSFSINTWTRHDVAVCTMNNNSAGQTLNAAVGYAGRYWNGSYAKIAFNSGYPAQNYNLASIPSPGQYLRACVAESFQQTTETLGMGCNWGPGISGGSWLIAYRPSVVGGQVNSVNSGLYVGQQNIYGARFNSNNIVPLCTARGC